MMTTFHQAPTLVPKAPRRRGRAWGLVALLALAGAGLGAATRSAPLAALPATVSADLLVLRAPIAGELREEDGRFAVENPRADRSRLADARAEAERAGDEVAQLEAAHAALTATMDRLAQASAQHRREAAAQIEAQSRETQQLRAAAEARAHRAAQEAARTASLARAGFASAAMVERAEADLAAARREAQALDMRLELQRRQAEATARGMFGNGFVLVGYAQERLDDVTLRRIETQRQLSAQRDALARAERRMREEERSLALASRAEVPAPQGLHLWRMRALAGQSLAAHEPVAELLDCRSAHVLVAVPQARVANALRAASVAVRIAGEAEDRGGRVLAIVDEAALAATAAAPRSGGAQVLRLALNPGAEREPCLVGRAATVSFAAK
jgi:hypothetical protein